MQCVLMAAVFSQQQPKYLIVCNGRGRQSGICLLNRLTDNAFIDALSPDKASVAGLIADFFSEDLQIKRMLTAKVNLVKQYYFL